jgi:hypothetical protein
VGFGNRMGDIQYPARSSRCDRQTPNSIWLTDTCGGGGGGVVGCSSPTALLCSALCVCVNVTAIATTAGSKQRLLLCCAPVCSIINLKFTHCCCFLGTGTHFVVQAFFLPCRLRQDRYGAAPIARRVVRALPLLLCCTQLTKKNQQKSFCHRPTTSPFPLLSCVI